MGILMTGCKKETTYTLKWNLDDTVPMDILIMEYSQQSEVIKNVPIYSVQNSFESIYTAAENSEKVKIQISWESNNTEYNRWVNQVYYLEKGENIDIFIDGNTIVGKQEP